MNKKIYFTPGPSQLYFTVEEHIKNALKKNILSISHRSKTFKILYEECIENIKILFNLNKNYHIAFTSSANEIWERIIQNLIVKTSIHYVNGSFSKKFYDYTKMYNIKIVASSAKEAPPTFFQGLIVHPLNPKAWLMIATASASFIPKDMTPLEAAIVLAPTFFVIQLTLHPIWCFFGSWVADRISGTIYKRFFVVIIMALTLLSVLLIVLSD